MKRYIEIVVRGDCIHTDAEGHTLGHVMVHPYMSDRYDNGMPCSDLNEKAVDALKHFMEHVNDADAIPEKISIEYKNTNDL